MEAVTVWWRDGAGAAVLRVMENVCFPASVAVNV